MSSKITILFNVLIFYFSTGCIAVTSAEDDNAETTQYLILQGPDDGEHLKILMIIRMCLALSIFLLLP